MNKEQLFEKLDYKEGDKIHVIVLREDGLQRINHGFNVFELLGLIKSMEHDLHKILDGKMIDIDVEKIKRTVLEDEDEVK